MSAVRATAAIATRPLWWGVRAVRRAVPRARRRPRGRRRGGRGADQAHADARARLAVLWGGRGGAWGTPYTLLFLAIAFSWLGDGAGAFFPFAGDPLPLMLLFFGLAHLCYMWLFWKHLAVRPLPPWAVGLRRVVGRAAARALAEPRRAVDRRRRLRAGARRHGRARTRCHPLVVWGGAFFLASDTILAFRIFMPEAMPPWTSPLVMLTYTARPGPHRGRCDRDAAAPGGGRMTEGADAPRASTAGSGPCASTRPAPPRRLHAARGMYGSTASARRPRSPSGSATSCACASPDSTASSSCASSS